MKSNAHQRQPISMSKGPLVKPDVWWPLLSGVSIGMQAMLTALVLFGPGERNPDVIAQLTFNGLANYAPEHDILIYQAGCVFTALLVLGLSWLWQRRSDSSQPGSAVIAPSGTRMIACGGLFISHLVFLLLFRRLFIAQHSEVPAFPLIVSIVLIAHIVGSLVLAAGGDIGIHLTRRGSRNRQGTPMFTDDFPKVCLHRWLDFLVPVFLCAVIYTPFYHNLAGRFFLVDELHHWDYFAIGPALAFRHGAALCADIYTQYGVGWPILYNLFAGGNQVDYGRTIQLSTAYGCLYYIGIYALLRLTTPHAVHAAMGTVLALALQFFMKSSIADILWVFPTRTMLRSAMDVWFFIALALHLRSRSASWALLAGAFVGLAIFLETDTGIYLAVVFLIYWVFLYGVPNDRPRKFLKNGIAALPSFAITLFVLLSGLAVASRGTIIHKDFWLGWTEAFRTFGGAVSGFIPIATVSDTTVTAFALVTGTHLCAVGIALIRLVRQQCTGANVLLGCLGSYGLLTLLLFVGRSTEFDFYWTAGMWFGAVFTIMAAQLHSQLQGFAVRQRERSARKFWEEFSAFVPWAALGCVCIGMLVSPVFHDYPNVISSIFVGAPPAGLSLLKSRADVSGLPLNAEPYVAMFEEVTQKLKSYHDSGHTVAVLDHADPIFYLAMDIRPWSHYSPLFSSISRRSDLANLQQQIATKGPDYVMIRSTGLYARARLSEDIWRAVHDTVEHYYTLDSVFGIFEVWRRNT